MSKSPAFSFYPDKWLSGTMHLSPRAYQAYHRCLCWMWQHSDTQCRIVLSENAICLATGLSKRTYKSVWLQEVMNPNHPLLRVEDKYLVSNGLRKERAKQDARSAKARGAANARYKQCPGDALALPSVSVSVSDSITEGGASAPAPPKLVGAERQETQMPTTEYVRLSGCRNHAERAREVFAALIREWKGDTQRVIAAVQQHTHAGDAPWTVINAIRDAGKKSGKPVQTTGDRLAALRRSAKLYTDTGASVPEGIADQIRELEGK